MCIVFGSVQKANHRERYVITITYISQLSPLELEMSMSGLYQREPHSSGCTLPESGLIELDASCCSVYMKTEMQIKSLNQNGKKNNYL